MELLRKYRISLNLFVDHDPLLFCDNVARFVADVEDVQRICLFVADLLNEDVTTTTYASSYPERRDPYSVWPATGAKIGDVCAKLLSELEKDPRRNILPILSCLVRSGGGVEAALKRIDATRRQEAGGE